ncbi:MAG: DUF11 domain-containing protein, partial [Oscillospiraceae bacterium]|nr:DUF11 domain-containing protein [Oscillospiraceae bacterium]
IEFVISVKNPYDYPYLIVTLTDKLHPDADKFGNFKTLYNFGKDDTDTVTFTYEVTEIDAALGYVENVATARALDGTHPVVVFPSNTVKVPAGGGKMETPSLSVVKTDAGAPKNGSFYVEGETITYNIEVSNNGKNTVTNVKVYDILDTDPTAAFATIPKIDPGKAETVQYQYTVKASDIDAMQVINAATAKVSVDPHLPEYSFMSPTVFSSVGKEDPIVEPPKETLKEELDKMIGLSGDTLPPDVPVKKPDGKVNVPTVTGGDESCLRTLVAVGETGSAYTLHFCQDHIGVAQAVDSMVSGAITEAEELAAWQQAKALWSSVLADQYAECVNASTGSARAAFLAEKDAFDQYVICLEAQLNQMHPDQPALVAQKIAELLRDRVTEGCYELNGNNGEREDSLFSFDHVTTDEEAILIDCGLSDAKKPNGDLICSEDLCEEHASAEQAVLGMMRDDMTAEEITDAWLYAQAIWQSELDTMTNTHYREADADGRLIIAANRMAFDQYLAMRQVTLDAMYADQPEIAAELLCDLIKHNVTILCEGW